jgi:hypothetical protein
MKQNRLGRINTSSAKQHETCTISCIATISVIFLFICAMGDWTRLPLYAFYPGPLISGEPGYNPTRMHAFAVVTGFGLFSLLIYACWRKSVAAVLTFWGLMIFSTVVIMCRIYSIFRNAGSM